MLLLLALGWANFSVFAQCLPYVQNCPLIPQYCSTADNNALLWNETYWWDPSLSQHNLAEGPADLGITMIDSCGGSALHFRYRLRMDLNADQVFETIIDSDKLPGWNQLYYNNVSADSLTGGELRSFDERAVTAQNKYGFALETTSSGNAYTARVRWNTESAPDAFVVPQLPLGTYSIEWSVEKDGQVYTCKYLFRVKDCGKPTITCVNSLSVNIMPTAMVALWAVDFLANSADNITPTNQIKIGIRRKGTGSGFPVDSTGATQANVVFTCNDLGTQPIELWAEDKAGNTAFCETTVIVQDNASNCDLAPAEPAVCVTTACGNEPMPDVKIFINNNGGGNPGIPPIGIFDPIATGADGCISETIFLGIPLNNYTAAPNRKTDPLNGVSTFDLILINKHLLGQQAFTDPWQYIAADANNSRSVTTFDIVELRKLILGVYPVLPNSDSWRFHPANFTFSPTNPFSVPIPDFAPLNSLPAAFKGVKIGDINCNSVAGNLQAHPDERSAVALDLPDQALVAGEVIDIPLRLSAAATWLGFQFELQIDPQLLDIEQVLPGQLPGLSEDAFALTPAGRLTASWFADAAQALPTGELICTIRVRARAALRLSEAVQLSTGRLSAEAYRPEGPAEALQLLYRSATDSALEVFLPQPNPTAGAAVLPLRLPEPATLVLELFNLSGQLLLSRQVAAPAGLNWLDIPAESMPEAGVYLWKVQAGTVSRSGKIVRR
ncbi:MAG: T9SS type A sorting domain-containing protein [Saprospiraceae bacterium]|nr:T9SS type A sorting domain-containing protein [Saprospiraceae bacterium]